MSGLMSGHRPVAHEGGRGVQARRRQGRDGMSAVTSRHEASANPVVRDPDAVNWTPLSLLAWSVIAALVTLGVGWLAELAAVLVGAGS